MSNGFGLIFRMFSNFDSKKPNLRNVLSRQVTWLCVKVESRVGRQYVIQS